VLRLLPSNGGVVMVTFVPEFLSPAVAAHARRRTEERRRLAAAFPTASEDERRKMVDAWTAEHPAPKATLGMVADHIDHIRAVAGIDHIGLGSDFDGIDFGPDGLEDVSKYPSLVVELLRRGYTDEDVKKILGLNMLRVMRQAEQVAARLRASRSPSTKTILEMDGDRKPRGPGAE
jgi:membrane dipeptidase